MSKYIHAVVVRRWRSWN